MMSLRLGTTAMVEARRSGVRHSCAKILTFRWKRAEQGCQSFVDGDDAEYSFACTTISLWEGARA